MIRVTCDSCTAPIDRDEGTWYGLDVSEPPAPINDDGESELLTLRVNGDHEFHFCSPPCLSAWAFGRGLESEKG